MSIDIDYLTQGILKGNTRILAKAITLIESKKVEHKQYAKQLLENIISHSGKSIRIGISGVPGVGKSTFIEALGTYLIECGHRVAVLAVDPSSCITGGSILGDKTRMEKLSRSGSAFIRPSPSAGSLGGVTRKTRETIFLCEAAGYDTIIVETVGVGQSEIAVSSMVDFFLLMQLPNAGDELQGIKRGIMEISDAVAVNKADGENLQAAKLAQKQLENTLHILNKDSVPVLLISARENKGIDKFWNIVEKQIKNSKDTSKFSSKRKKQAKDWMWNSVMDGLRDMFLNNKDVIKAAGKMEKSIENQTTTPSLAAEYILDVFKKNR